MLTTITLLAVASEGNAFSCCAHHLLLPVASPIEHHVLRCVLLPCRFIDEGEGCGRYQ